MNVGKEELGARGGEARSRARGVRLHGERAAGRESSGCDEVWGMTRRGGLVLDDAVTLVVYGTTVLVDVVLVVRKGTNTEELADAVCH